MAGDIFRRNRPFHQLDGFYTDWSRHLTNHCIPLFRRFQPSDATNAAVLRHIHSYYDTLNHYANKETILYFLFPSWRSNSLETPLLFLGDIHPRLFTTLIQSFIDRLNQDPICSTYSNLSEWEDLSIKLGDTINVTVTRLLGEMREAQDRFIKQFSNNWVSSFRSRTGTVLMETAISVMEEEDGVIMEELVRIFVEANQLRKDTISHIVGVLNKKQMALFLESLCKFLAGFKHQDKAFQNSLFGKHLIIQQLPADDQLLPRFEPSGEVIAPHQNYPPHMMHQYNAPFAAQFPPPNHTVPLMNQHQQHAPEQGHVIYVGNLAKEATPELLHLMFSRYYRSVRGTKICLHKRRGHKYGFVSFADEREKWHAMKAMNLHIFLEQQMYIGPAAKNAI